MKHRKTIWKWFAMALGEKASKCDKESDVVARIRAVIFLTYLITNCFIIAGVIRHWNDKQDDQVSSSIPQTKEEVILKTDSNILYYWGCIILWGMYKEARMQGEWDYTCFVAIYTKKTLKSINKCINKYKSPFYCILNSVILIRIRYQLMSHKDLWELWFNTL